MLYKHYYKKKVIRKKLFNKIYLREKIMLIQLKSIKIKKKFKK